MVVFGQKWLYSGKSGCVRAKVVVFEKIVCIPGMWLYSGKVVVFGKKIVVIRQNCPYSGKSGCIWAKFFLFGQKWL